MKENKLLRGTKILKGDELNKFNEITSRLIAISSKLGFEQVIFPNISNLSLFKEKVTEEIASRQMWNWQDKKGRDVCLNPEITALFQANYDEMPDKVFYLQKCYRYERPQKGRLREFWQFGLESKISNNEEMQCIAEILLDSLNIKYKINSSVKRGMGYYTKNGFEAENNSLGSQKQILGGGSYKGGCGFAFGIDRLMLIRKIDCEN